MAILVTGATGLLGNNLVRYLLAQGQAVRVLTRITSDPRPLEGLSVDLVKGDVREPGEVARAMAGVEGVIHSAAQVHIGWTGLELARAVNVDGTRHVALAALERGVRMVHISSVDALGLPPRGQTADESSLPGGKPLIPYVATKIAAEKVIAELLPRGLQAVIVNPGFMLGPWDWKPSSGRMLLEVAQRTTPAAPTGGCSVCDVRDVTKGTWSAYRQGKVGERYILAGQNLSYFQLWRMFSKLGGGAGPWLPAGPLIRVIGGWGGDLWTRISGHEGAVNSAALSMGRLRHFYSSARAAAELGYVNRPLRETLQDTWQWFVDNNYVRKE